MAAYYVRLFLKGLVAWVFATFIIYSIFISAPSGRHVICCPRPVQQQALIQQLTREFQLDKPWPYNYLAWLLTPGRPSIYLFSDYTPPGLDVTIAGIPITGYGILTGDLGLSLVIQRGVPVTQVVGPGAFELPATLFGAMVILMIIALVQRWGRPSIHPSPSQSGTLAVAERALGPMHYRQVA